MADSIRYPDAFVTCGPIPRDVMLLHDPVVRHGRRGVQADLFCCPG